ncbi:MAG: NAD-glutamate dehydrogenase, partial [Alphaproteobacteria bacterium]
MSVQDKKSEAAASAGRDLPAGERREFRKFVAYLYDRVEYDDLAGATPRVLEAIAFSYWKFFEHRPSGMRLVRVFNPDPEEDGWNSRHTIIDIVCDDMPFIIDSVLGELNDLGLRIHGILHPIVEVRRDAGGLRKAVESAEFTEDSKRAEKSARDKGYVRESLMHLAVDRQDDPEVLSRIQLRILNVLADVELAVTDWRPMRQLLRDLIAAMRGRPPGGSDPDEWEEVRAFLEWMHSDHFAFLGMRDYQIVGGVEEGELQSLPDSGLGLLRDPNAHVLRRKGELVSMTPEVREFLMTPSPIIVTKANVRSTVHRRVYMDYVGVKLYGGDGEVVGERRIVGLFTAVAYNRSPFQIPLLKRKARIVVERAHLPPEAHDERALINILETFPRDEFFQVTEDELLRTALGILRLQKRPRTKIFVRHDRFDRFVSVLVFVLRDRYDSDLRVKVGEMLAEAFEGRVSSFYPSFGDGPLARVHFIIGRRLTPRPEPDLDALEQRIDQAARNWADDLRDAIDEREPGLRARELYERYGRGFPAAYVDEFTPGIACADINVMEALDERRVAITCTRQEGEPDHTLHVKLFNWDDPLPLSDCLPVFENMGLRVLDESPYRVDLRRDTGRTAAGVSGGGRSIWIHNFRMEHIEGRAIGVPGPGGAFERAFEAIWFGRAENDNFNRLVLEQTFDWQDVVILRTYAKFLRQAGQTYSLTYMADALSAHGDIAWLLVEFFRIRFDPSLDCPYEERRAQAEGLRGQINDALEGVESLDSDRIIRNVAHLIHCTLRTSYYQTNADGMRKDYLSVKIESSRIDILPLPRPWAEIFVYSPRVEGVHLRQGAIARGGLRWSDRREDFRTEVLSLVKAQQVKNAVIVPVGAKGGFVPKQLPEAGTRDDIQREAIACYRTFISALLDVTDNVVDGKAVRPRDVVIHDNEDPYLVVAADKGTASFSDIANEVAASYDFWLGDAFASGGSQGYDHKKMAITARGAWEAVKRHFREMGIDTQTAPFTVVGVGDMSGDVFGNGMLLSRQIRLIAAFDHRDIFIDPDPDPETSYRERRRLFELPRSSWADYDTGLISSGGGVYSRSRKSIPLSAAARRVLRLDHEQATPVEVIRAILTAQADLLWFGGIGTYVKASTESNFQVGDPSNDQVRVNADELRARVIGEGANLGCTQRGRVEYARRGGRINTDAVDNAAGVDTSDHEVNIKIALGNALRAGRLDMASRNALLSRMTEDVASLVLQNNYRQTLALTLAEATAPADIDAHGRFMRILERKRLLDRKVEFLPDDEALQELKDRGQGLTRPEISVLLAYSKITLFDELVDSVLPDDPFLNAELMRYFPEVLSTEFPEEIAAHRLRREIIASSLANDVVNTGGLAFVNRTRENLGHSAPDIVRCYVAARELFELRALRDGINALDLALPASVQTQLHLSVIDFLRSQVLWFLRYCAETVQIGEVVDHYAQGLGVLRSRIGRALTDFDRRRYEKRLREWVSAGVPEELAARVTMLTPLASACDIVDIAAAHGW